MAGYGGYSDEAMGGMADTGGGFMSQPSASQEGERRKVARGTQALVPVTIRMALGAAPAEDGENFMIEGREVPQVRVVGNVLRVDQKETKSIYCLEDSTGAIEVTQWVNSGDEELQTLSDRKLKMQPKTYVTVVGHLKQFDGKVTISAYDMRPVEDHNELTHHFLEVIYVHAKKDQQPSWQPNPAPAAIMDVDAANDDGNLTSIQRKVLDYYNQNGTGDEGLNINFVISNCCPLFNCSAADVKAAVDVLISEGHLYSTLDDDHHKSTDSD